MKFKIGNKNSIFLNCNFDSSSGLKLENNCVINAKCRFDTRGGISIGSNVSISEEVVLLTAYHDPNTSDFYGKINGIRIEDYVWIGTRAMILPGVTLQKGSLVAAGAVVTKSVPPFEIWGGVPAKKIGERNRELDYTVKYRRFLH
ncbi:acyltransferase [Aurantibacter sp.]|uniref:acyltransferase n=1 Tax=Aurantibacter sp. TaxID=2807103 RepID=UPI003265ACEB